MHSAQLTKGLLTGSAEKLGSQCNATEKITSLFNGVELLKGSLPSDGVLGLYFSAHWCPPCRGFTPKLAQTYQHIKKADCKPFEIVFISSDHNQGQFDAYFAEMPWLALPFGQRAVKDELSKKFEVDGIPSLILLDAKTGAVISADGRAALSSDPAGENYPWNQPNQSSKVPATSTPHIHPEPQIKRHEASEVGLCSAMEVLFFPVLCATVCLLIASLPYLVVAAVKGPGTEFCNGYWQNSTTTSMRAELGGRVRPRSETTGRA
jgi:thiol-disulfide isomerase/thioredoxin